MTNDGQYWLSRFYFLMLLSFFSLSSSVSYAQTSGETLVREQDVKLVWSANNYGHGEQIYFSSYEKNRWGVPVQLSDTFDMVFQPACSFGADRKVWAVWSRQDKNGSFLQYAVFNGSKWMSPVQIDTGMSNNKAVTIMVDGNNVPWIAWTAIDDMYPDVFLSRWNGKGWDAPVRVHEENNVPDVQPLLGLDEAGNVCLSWKMYAAGKYVTLSKVWNGRQWQAVSSDPEKEIQKKVVQREKGGLPVPAFVEDPRKATLFIKGQKGAVSLPLALFTD
jgi:hypothetical protein